MSLGPVHMSNLYLGRAVNPCGADLLSDALGDIIVQLQVGEGAGAVVPVVDIEVAPVGVGAIAGVDERTSRIGRGSNPLAGTVVRAASARADRGKLLLVEERRVGVGVVAGGAGEREEVDDWAAASVIVSRIRHVQQLYGGTYERTLRQFARLGPPARRWGWPRQRQPGRRRSR